MAQYTIEDIEILRKKSGITYEEAVNLLEYHNGSLARSLVDLEKNGRINPDKQHSGGGKAKGVFNFLFRLRFKLLKKDITIVNVSSITMLLVFLFAPHVVIFGLLAALVLGYRISGEKNSTDFAGDGLDSMIKNAKDNVHNTVNNFSKQFMEHEEQPKAAPEASKPRAESAPSGTTPVNVQFPGGGRVDVREDGDGYHEADIQ